MNSIEFTLDRYNNNSEQMYQDIAKQLQLLHYNGYDCRVWSRERFIEEPCKEMVCSST